MVIRYHIYIRYFLCGVGVLAMTAIHYKKVISVGAKIKIIDDCAVYVVGVSSCDSAVT